MAHHWLLTTTFIAFFVFSRVSAAQCYHLDGSKADETHQPCDPEAETSACCALNKGGPDVCLSSGLCYAQEPNHRGLIYSNGCTDPTGKAEECPHFCPDRRDDWNGGSEVEAWNVLQCNSGGQFCCRAAGDRDNCCDNSTAVDTFNIGSLVLPSSTSTASVTTSGTITGPIETEASKPSQSATADCPVDNSVVVGGAIGGALGAALLASLAVTVIMWKRRPVTQPASRSYVHVSEETMDGKQYGGNGFAAHELDARQGISELRGS